MGDLLQELGIDEAGYAPRLGPLVVTAVSVSRPGAVDLYEALQSTVCRTARGKRGADGVRRIHVGDSKKVYSPARGMAELERGVLAFASCALGAVPEDDLDLARGLTGGMIDIEGLPWYGGPPAQLPVSAEAEGVREAARRLATALASAGTDGLHIRSRFITARDLNSGVDEDRNKADLLCSLVAGLLAELGAQEGTTDATIDRLGGRKDYRPLLEDAWPGCEVTSVAVGSRSSSYRACGPGSIDRDVAFACRAEDASLPVALASMVSKYLRELFMGRLNRWFASHIEGIEPTAGYPVDAARFLKESEAFRESHEVSDGMLIRSR